MRHEHAVFLGDDTRARLLRACFDSYYTDPEPARITFDTNRMWTTKLHILTRLFPVAKTICCVRNPAWIVDGVESLIRRNAFDVSGIFVFDPAGTV